MTTREVRLRGRDLALAVGAAALLLVVVLAASIRHDAHCERGGEEDAETAASLARQALAARLLSAEQEARASEHESRGETVVFLALDGRLAGMLAEHTTKMNLLLSSTFRMDFVYLAVFLKLRNFSLLDFCGRRVPEVQRNVNLKISPRGFHFLHIETPYSDEYLVCLLLHI